MITDKFIKIILVQFIERDTVSRVIHYTVGKLRRHNLFATDYPNLIPNQLHLIIDKSIKIILVQFIEQDTVSCVIHYTVGKLRR